MIKSSAIYLFLILLTIILVGISFIILLNINKVDDINYQKDFPAEIIFSYLSCSDEKIILDIEIKENKDSKYNLSQIRTIRAVAKGYQFSINLNSDDKPKSNTNIDLKKGKQKIEFNADDFYLTNNILDHPNYGNPEK